MNKDKNKELAIFWARSQPQIVNYINAQVSNFQDADDIMQSVAVITVDKFDTFDRSGSFTSWAIGIARNLILMYYAEKRKNRVMLDHDAMNLVSEVYEAESQSIVEHKKNVNKHLKSCLEMLKHKWKKIVEMHYYSEMSPNRIAQQLSMTRNNVFVSLHRIRLALKKCVEKKLKEVQQ